MFNDPTEANILSLDPLTARAALTMVIAARQVGVPLIVISGRRNSLQNASVGGAPNNPVWVHNLRADPTAAVVQDGAEAVDVTVREVTGDERNQWWERAVEAYPDYADYQSKTERLIPVFVASPRA